MKPWQVAALVFTAPLYADEPPVKLAERLERRGDEIMVCGQLYHTTTRVVLWTDRADMTRIGSSLGSLSRSPPTSKAEVKAAAAAPTTASDCAEGAVAGRDREGARRRVGPADARAGRGSVRHSLRRRRHQPALFSDSSGRRGLSVQFMLDLDGTIYQTLDVKERPGTRRSPTAARSGSKSRTSGLIRSMAPTRWLRTYQPDPAGRSSSSTATGIRPRKPRARQTSLRPSRNELVVGTIQGKKLKQYDFTPQQYAGARQAGGDALQALSQDPARLSARRERARSSRTSLPTPTTSDIKGFWATTTCRRTRSTRARRFSGTLFVQVDSEADQVMAISMRPERVGVSPW